MLLDDLSAEPGMLVEPPPPALFAKRHRPLGQLRDVVNSTVATTRSGSAALPDDEFLDIAHVGVTGLESVLVAGIFDQPGVRSRVAKARPSSTGVRRAPASPTMPSSADDMVVLETN